MTGRSRWAFAAIMTLCIVAWLLWSHRGERQKESREKAAPVFVESTTASLPPGARPSAPATESTQADSVPAVASTEKSVAPVVKPSPDAEGRVVVGEPPRGVPGVTVAIEMYRYDEPPLQAGFAVTDENGRFEMSALEKGKQYTITPLVRAGYTTPWAESFIVSPGSTHGPYVFVWHPEGATIVGTVCDTAPDYSRIDFEKAVRAAFAHDTAEVDEDYKTMMAPHPKANVVVKLSGESVVRQALTGPEGLFEFPDLMFGEYEVWFDPPVKAGPAEGVKQKVKVTEARVEVKLTFRSDLVNLKGRVLDMNGRPIADAKVTAVYDVPRSEWGDDMDSGEVERARNEWVAAHTRTAISGSDGSYELQGLEPTARLFDVCGYLAWGALRAVRHVGIHAEAEGFVQRKEDMPDVPILTETQLAPARRWLKAVLEEMHRQGVAEAPGRGEPYLPASDGNTITGVDVVMEKR